VATPRLASLTLPAADGGTLPVDIRTGAREGEPRPTVVICHGFNLSGSGVSGGDVFDEPDRWFRQRPSWDLEDVGTVVEWAVSGGAPWVALVGHSRGGGLAILQAARDRRVRALVTWNAIDHFLRWPEEDIARWRRDGRIEVLNTRTGQSLPIGRDTLDDIDRHGDEALNIRGAAGRIRVPWLIVHGLADQAVPVSVGRDLAARSTGPATLHLVEGADHTFGCRHPWAGSTAAFDDVLERTARHLAGAL
jgi:pimeloyl-ACP methyl ester carboxylesterase